MSESRDRRVENQVTHTHYQGLHQLAYLAPLKKSIFGFIELNEDGDIRDDILKELTAILQLIYLADDASNEESHKAFVKQLENLVSDDWTSSMATQAGAKEEMLSEIQIPNYYMKAAQYCSTFLTVYNQEGELPYFDYWLFKNKNDAQKMEKIAQALSLINAWKEKKTQKNKIAKFLGDSARSTVSSEDRDARLTQCYKNALTTTERAARYELELLRKDKATLKKEAGTSAAQEHATTLLPRLEEISQVRARVDLLRSQNASVKYFPKENPIKNFFKRMARFFSAWWEKRDIEQVKKQVSPESHNNTPNITQQGEYNVLSTNEDVKQQISSNSGNSTANSSPQNSVCEDSKKNTQINKILEILTTDDNNNVIEAPQDHHDSPPVLVTQQQQLPQQETQISVKTVMLQRSSIVVPEPKKQRINVGFYWETLYKIEGAVALMQQQIAVANTLALNGLENKHHVLWRVIASNIVEQQQAIAEGARKLEEESKSCSDPTKAISDLKDRFIKAHQGASTLYQQITTFELEALAKLDTFEGQEILTENDQIKAMRLLETLSCDMGMLGVISVEVEGKARFSKLYSVLAEEKNSQALAQDFATKLKQMSLKALAACTLPERTLAMSDADYCKAFSQRVNNVLPMEPLKAFEDDAYGYLLSTLLAQLTLPCAESSLKRYIRMADEFSKDHNASCLDVMQRVLRDVEDHIPGTILGKTYEDLERVKALMVGKQGSYVPCATHLVQAIDKVAGSILRFEGEVAVVQSTLEEEVLKLSNIQENIFKNPENPELLTDMRVTQEMIRSMQKKVGDTNQNIANAARSLRPALHNLQQSYDNALVSVSKDEKSTKSDLEAAVAATTHHAAAVTQKIYWHKKSQPSSLLTFLVKAGDVKDLEQITELMRKLEEYKVTSPSFTVFLNQYYYKFTPPQALERFVAVLRNGSDLSFVVAETEKYLNELGIKEEHSKLEAIVKECNSTIKMSPETVVNQVKQIGLKLVDKAKIIADERAKARKENVAVVKKLADQFDVAAGNFAYKHFGSGSNGIGDKLTGWLHGGGANNEQSLSGKPSSHWNETSSTFMRAPNTEMQQQQPVNSTTVTYHHQLDV